MTDEKLENNPMIVQIMSERSQDATTRKHLFKSLENELGRPVISYFTSFRHPVIIDDSDADMLEGLLQGMDLSNGLALMINSPGGDGTAAERIINVCRSYSKTGEFWAIVPGKAKSAATMVCLGASKVFMAPASELGPVDPQIPLIDDNNRAFYVSLFHIVESYDSLFKEAVNTKDGKLEPYLQQLSKYDASLIAHFRSGIALSEDISIKALQSGMMNGQSYEDIKEKVKVFLTPETVKTHGRPIFRDVAESVGLNIEKIDNRGSLGASIYELYIRMKFCADDQTAKLIENKDGSVFVNPE